MDKTPCFGCEQRCYLCHSHCTKYAAWTKKLQLRNQQIREAKQRMHDVDAFVVEQKKRVRQQQQTRWVQKYREKHRKG